MWLVRNPSSAHARVMTEAPYRGVPWRAVACPGMPVPPSLLLFLAVSPSRVQELTFALLLINSGAQDFHSRKTCQSSPAPLPLRPPPSTAAAFHMGPKTSAREPSPSEGVASADADPPRHSDAGKTRPLIPLQLLENPPFSLTKRRLKIFFNFFFKSIIIIIIF